MRASHFTFMPAIGLLLAVILGFLVGTLKFGPWAGAVSAILFAAVFLVATREASRRLKHQHR